MMKFVTNTLRMLPLVVVVVHSFNVIETRKNPLGRARRIAGRHDSPFGSRLVLSGASSDAIKGTSQTNHIVFEYCTGCRWMARSSWMAQELLTTFNEDNLSAVTLVPSPPPPGARFVVKYSGEEEIVLWDREKQDGFPEVKELKQVVRDKIDPDLYLGHSDTAKRDQDDASSVEPESSLNPPSSAAVLTKVLEQVEGPNVAIQYCTGCRWMLRSAYFATELMTTFSDELNSMTLIPSRPPEKGGVFTVTVNGEVVWDREEQGGFPETKELKQLVRDLLSPSKDLGHSDNGKADSDADEIDDDDAKEMRAFYGVQ